MATVLTTTSSLGSFAAEQGQEACIPLAKQAGCSGIEIRRELFGGQKPELGGIKLAAQRENLFSVYSAPVELWLEDGKLNEAMLDIIVPEALELGAVFVKTSLGHYLPGVSDLETLNRYLKVNFSNESALKLTVENDQTAHGGDAALLERFFEDSKAAGIPVGMTFDTGNWNWSGENPLHAASVLGRYVVYIHLKHVETFGGKLETLPLPEESNSEWKRLLSVLPRDVPRTIEFPVQGEDLAGVLKDFVELIGKN